MLEGLILFEMVVCVVFRFIGVQIIIFFNVFMKLFCIIIKLLFFVVFEGQLIYIYKLILIKVKRIKVNVKIKNVRE